jgi:hypothetical protein
MVKKINTPLTFNTLRMGKAPEVRMVDVSASAPKSLKLFPKKTIDSKLLQLVYN